MGSLSVSSCRCCMFMSRVHHVAGLNAAFCRSFSLLMLVEDARSDHMEEATIWKKRPYGRGILRCTQGSILLDLIDFFLPCIRLWQILQIQTCLCVVVGSGFVSTLPAFMRSNASYPAGPHGRLAQITVNRAHC